MFNKKKIEKENSEIVNLELTITTLRKAATDRDNADKIAELKHKIIVKELDNKEKSIDQSVKLRIQEETANFTKERVELKSEIREREAEIKMLRGAFENLGFDVKDMKGILDKLVEGLISKNAIQLVK